ncbi:MAG: orotate phosphoribosyltransferase [Candidatus Bathyarchaeia archaeon]
MSAGDSGSKTYMIAESLVRSGALKFGTFILKSGLKSPYYIDLTWLLSSPEDFERVSNIIAEEIGKTISERVIDKLATIELKGALILPHVASILKIPCIVIRKESKSYGLTGRIVGGEVRRGERFLFFDDVITDGRSKIEGIKPIEEMGGIVDTVIVLVDREQGGRENLESMGYRVKAIATISEIINSLLSAGKISEEEARKILDYVRGGSGNL